MTALVNAQNISVDFSGRTTLSNVSLQLTPSEIVTIVGPNGSGKSTLIKALLRIIPLKSGAIWHKPNLRIGYVPQRLDLNPSLPINLRRFLSLPNQISDQTAMAALQRVGLEHAAHIQMINLSGGQRQRALLARALLQNPHLFILDEPAQGLDQQGEAQFYQLIEDLRRETKAAILMVSHDLHVVMAASDRVICLNGHICCEGAPHIVSNRPEYRALFGLGTRGALALYRHEHDHHHDPHDHTCQTYTPLSHEAT